jgi:hypothetical protein
VCKTTNDALTVRSEFIVTAHVDDVPEPEQSPPQPANVDPEPGVSVSVTGVPAG